MEYGKRLLCEVGFYTDEGDDDRIPEIKPFVIDETGEGNGKTVHDYMLEGVAGIYKLAKLFSWMETEAFKLENSITYELSQHARKILDTCDENSYTEYLCALFELESMMPCRHMLAMDQIYNSGATGFFDFVLNHSAKEHLEVLETIVDAYETAPVYRYVQDHVDYDFLKVDGSVGVCAGMHVIIREIDKLQTDEVVEGYVEDVINHNGYYGHGILVRLCDGKIGCVVDVVGN